MSSIVRRPDHHCPKCGSTEVEGHNYAFDQRGGIEHEFSCLACEASWLGFYHPTGCQLVGWSEPCDEVKS